MTETTFENKCNILSDFYFDFKYNPGEWENFIKYNDLGLPMAFMCKSGLINPTERGISMINETWTTFLALLEIEDSGFENIDDLLFPGEID